MLFDIKYKEGENNRCYRIAQQNYFYQVQSKSQDILFADNDLLKQNLNDLKLLYVKKSRKESDNDIEEETENKGSNQYN